MVGEHGIGWPGRGTDPTLDPSGVVVRVKAISLNRGEIYLALEEGVHGARPGADFAGVVETAPEGSGFWPGMRVAGLVPGRARAERVVAPPFLLAQMPDGVSFEEGAALPMAGLTARLALDVAGPLDGRRVMITGATGGVGLLAVQLAVHSGAVVTALARRLART